MAKAERSPIEKLYRRLLWAALPVALLSNGIAQDVARTNYYSMGTLIIYGSLAAVVLIFAFATLKRDDLLRYKVTWKYALLPVGCLIGSIALILLFLWMVTQLKVSQAQLQEFKKTINPSATGSAGPAPWGTIGLSFLYIILVLIIPFVVVVAQTTVVISVLAVIWARGINYIDDCDWCFRAALQAFANSPSELANPMKKNLNKAEIARIQQTAFTGPGFFISWLICHDGTGKIHENKQDVLEQVRSGKLSGTNFLIYHCNSQLAERDVAPEFLEFAELYYSHYLNEYALWYQERRNPDDHLYIGNWKDYQEFSRVIDENYSSFLISRGAVFDGESTPENSPFLRWQERDIPEALIVKASWIYGEAYQQVGEAAGLAGDEVSNSFTSIIRGFVKNFNILNRYNEFVDATESEEIYAAALKLRLLAQEQCGQEIAEDDVIAIFASHCEWSEEGSLWRNT